MSSKPLPQVTAEIFTALSSLSPEDRKKVINAAFALLGEPMPQGERAVSEKGQQIHPQAPEVSHDFGPKGRNWLTQHRLSREKLERVFYFQDGKVDIHLNTIPGDGRKEQTINCYLLVGARAYLESDNPTFTDSEAIALCKHTSAYDKNNHTTYRKSLGNQVNGSRHEGYSLTGPGLKAAAELISRIADSSAA